MGASLRSLLLIHPKYIAARTTTNHMELSKPTTPSTTITTINLVQLTLLALVAHLQLPRQLDRCLIVSTKTRAYHLWQLLRQLDHCLTTSTKIKMCPQTKLRGQQSSMAHLELLRPHRRPSNPRHHLRRHRLAHCFNQPGLHTRLDHRPQVVHRRGVCSIALISRLLILRASSPQLHQERPLRLSMYLLQHPQRACRQCPPRLPNSKQAHQASGQLLPQWN